MRERIAEDLKTALKGGDKQRAATLRMANAAIKDRDIANRGTGKPAAGADEILQILTKMVKQREESAKAFEQGGRPELAAQERAEIAILQEFLPAQMDEAATESGNRCGDPRHRRHRSGRYGQGDGGAEAALCRADGFRPGERAGQGAAQLARPTPQLPPLCIAGTPAAVARFCPKDWLDRMAMRFPARLSR